MRIRGSAAWPLIAAGMAALIGLGWIGWIAGREHFTRSSPPPVAVQGKIDSTSWNFTQDGPLLLKGEWEFYPDQLLMPGSNTAAPSSSVMPMPLRVPGSWNRSVGFSGYGTGTYRLLLHTHESGTYALRMKKTRMASRVFINGRDIGGSGAVSSRPADFVPNNLPFYGAIHLDPGETEIIVQVANFIYPNGGLIQAPVFGLSEDVLRQRDLSRMMDIALISVLLIFSIYFAALQGKWGSERYIVFLSLFCLTCGLYFLFDNEIVVSSLWPDVPFAVTQKLLYMLSLACSLCYSIYIQRFLNVPDRRMYRSLRSVLYACLAILPIVPNEWLSRGLTLGALAQALLFATIFHAFYIGRKQKVSGYGYVFVGVFFMVINMILAYLRFQYGIDINYVGATAVLLLVMSQAFLLAMRFRSAYDRIKQLSDELVKHDKLKDEFLAKTSHELRTPLHGIINLSESVLHDSSHPLAPAHRENMLLLSSIGRRLSGLIGDILDMSLIKQGQFRLRPTVVDVRAAAAHTLYTLNTLRANRKVRVIDELPEDLPYVIADENRVRQILSNLLENALKFTQEGTVRLYAQVQPAAVAVTVEDTGAGIAEERLERIFRPFEQGGEPHERNDGIGLGLSITKQLVELQSGTLEVRSKPGRGSQFTFTLPIASAGASSVGAASSAGAAETAAVAPWRPNDAAPPRPAASPLHAHIGADGSKGCRVWIVDDEWSNLKIVIDAVSDMQYGYAAATGGEEALEWLRKSENPPDLVLLDLMMPRISGLTVCREIRRSYSLSQLPILMLTASGQAADVLASFEAGANDILHKPFELAELKARVQSLLLMKRSADEAVRKESELLQAQITPHFLYNSLNSLLGLSYKDPEKLRKTIHHLSTYLRSKFTFVFGRPLIPLKQELELVRAYMFIEQLRFGDRLRIRWDMEESADCLVPPLTIQPLVENAVRHGIGPKPEGGWVRVAVRRGAGETIISVEDNGVGMEQTALERLTGDRGIGNGPSAAPPSTGIGISNVRRRLHMTMGRTLAIRSMIGQGTEVTFSIPEEQG